jgi:hypothetical protein
MAIKGRHWFVFWLASLCVALWLVVWRQTDSLRTARTLGGVRTQRATLRGGAAVQRRIRSASSRAQLIPSAGEPPRAAAGIDSEISTSTSRAPPRRRARRWQSRCSPQALEVAILAGLAAVAAGGAGALLRAAGTRRRRARSERAHHARARRGGSTIAISRRSLTQGPTTSASPRMSCATRCACPDPGPCVAARRRWCAEPPQALRIFWRAVQRRRSAAHPPLRGVHLEPVLNRFYPAPILPARWSAGGTVTAAYRGRAGVDSLLAGQPGAAVVLKDRAGREWNRPPGASPRRSGADVAHPRRRATGNARRALQEALRQTDAAGGDVVMLDPGLASCRGLAASRRRSPPSAFTETYEPGSCQFFAAAARSRTAAPH